MRTPTVRELPLELEPLSDDTFLPAAVAKRTAGRPVHDDVGARTRAASCADCSGGRPRCRVHGPVAYHAVSRPDHDLVALVHAARAGGAAAWERLVQHFEPPLRRIAASYRLTPAEVDDVIQMTWLRLCTHINGLREPAAVFSWLATTTRRECIRFLQLRMREQLTDDLELGAEPDEDGPEMQLLSAERHVVLRRALATLPERQRRLMTMIVTEGPLDYQQIGAILAMPTGSIGPTRSRSLARLQRDPALRALCSIAD